MDKLMPDPVALGEQQAGVISFIITVKRDEMFAPNGVRQVMGFNIPEWQRGITWSEAQQISFIESAWKGIPLGTFTYNDLIETSLDGVLIDGQQRIYSIERYLNDEFEVFGYRWSDLTPIDHRAFKNRHFSAYKTKSNDEEYLKSYYDLMNFGGVDHKPSERAVPTPRF